MKLNEFVKNLYDEMEDMLKKISEKETDFLQSPKESSTVILKAIVRLKSYINNYKFKDKNEEIFFFKNTKPAFLNQLLYYQSVFKIQSHKPYSSPMNMRMYYEKEIVKINDYFNRNNDFFIYYKTKASYLDEVYFLRKEPDSWLLLNFDDYQTDLNFTTVYDHKLSKFIALEKLYEFISNEISTHILQTENAEVKSLSDMNEVKWTASKVSLVELLYALQSAGSCNNGAIDLKHLASHMEQLFKVDLGNYYRMFQEMRIRKINRTSFLDQLKERLIQRMDEADENPKFRL